MNAAGSACQLAPDQAHIWWIDLDQMSDCGDILTPSELARAARFRHLRDRRRWIAARAALRQILACYVGNAPATLVLEPSLQGKPALAPRSPFRFSLTHAGHRAALAVSWQREVGIDLESTDPDLPGRHDLPALLTTACTATETARIEALPVRDQVEAFLEIWTLKEAYLKGIGAGLTREPEALEVTVGEDGQIDILDFAMLPSSLVPSNSLPWTLQLLRPGPGWIAALAVAGEAPQIVEYSWPAPHLLA